MANGLVDPAEAWNTLWNLDNELRPWELLSPEERKRWCQYVDSGAYQEARKKAEEGNYD